MFPNGHWLATGDLEVVSTTDYGAHWKVSEVSLERASIGSHVIRDISFYDIVHGCAVVDWSTLICTADGGQTWSRLSVPRKPARGVSFESDALKQIVLLPNGNGWIVSEGGWLYQTKDFGQTWADFDLLKAVP